MKFLIPMFMLHMQDKKKKKDFKVKILSFNNRT